MDTFVTLVGFIACSVAIMIFMLFVLYLIRKDTQMELKKLDIIHKKLMDLKYR